MSKNKDELQKERTSEPKVTGIGGIFFFQKTLIRSKNGIAKT